MRVCVHARAYDCACTCVEVRVHHACVRQWCARMHVCVHECLSPPPQSLGSPRRTLLCAPTVPGGWTWRPGLLEASSGPPRASDRELQGRHALAPFRFSHPDKAFAQLLEMSLPATGFPLFWRSKNMLSGLDKMSEELG